MFKFLRSVFRTRADFTAQGTQKQYRHVFTVDATVHAMNRKFIDDMSEHGGTMTLNVPARTLTQGKTTGGAQYDAIEITRGIVDFHTHPAKCLNDSTCALGVPSPADITNVVVGHLYGSQGHLVYAKEGTYTIQLQPRLVELLKCDFDALVKYVHDLEAVSDDLYNALLKNRMSYKVYVQSWLRAMKMCGLNVKLFPGNKVPRVTLYYAAAEAKNPELYREIAVPSSVTDNNGLCQRRTKRMK